MPGVVSKKPVILFLYSELAEYFLVCARRFLAEFNGEIHIVHWSVNKEAPFQFDLSAFTTYSREDYDTRAMMQLVEDIKPDALVCSGWMDKGYKSVCKVYRGKIPVIVTVDNQWRGNLKQRAASVLSPAVVKPYYSHAWVPGPRQRAFVSKLGFSDDTIKEGFYSADVDYFSALKKNYEAEKAKNFPKRFLYVGRYLPHKHVEQLWEAFARLANKGCDWELWCVGTGDLYEARMEHPAIRHFGFIQPADLETVIAGTGVFVLPSGYEPWGVVLQEYALAGYPLICTNEVGASETFLKDGFNGFMIDEGTVDLLYGAMKKITEMPIDQLLEMGNRSAKRATVITPTTWSHTLMEFVTEKSKTA